MHPISDTRTAILDAAQDMVQRQSLSEVSFQEIADCIGIKKGSMYHHFKSKEGLALAMLDRARLALTHSFERGLDKTPRQRLEYFLLMYRDYIGVGEKMCPAGANAAQWDKLTDKVQVATNKLVGVQFQGIEDILRAGIDNGEFLSHGYSVDELAIWLITTLQGALLTGRIIANQRPFDISFNIIGQYLYSGEIH